MSGEVAITPRTIIEAFLPRRGSVSLALVYDTANAAGISDQTLRLGIRRMVAAREVVQDGRGRRAGFSLTDAGRQRLDRDRMALRLAFAQDHGLAPWDGYWRLLALSAPESERATRDLLRRRLVDAGAAVVSTGLYLSPHDLGDLLEPAQRDRLVRASATEVTVRGVSDPLEVAELLWPPGPVAEHYRELGQLLTKPTPASDESVEAVLVAQLGLAEGLERAMRPDPLIPPELRRGLWEPAAIRARWREAWRGLGERLPEETLYRGWLPDGPG